MKKKLINGKQLIDTKQFLERVVDLSVDDNGIVSIKQKGHNSLAAIVQIGGTDIFHFSDDDQFVCYNNFAKATQRLGCQHKYIFLNGCISLAEQKDYLKYKIDKQPQPFLRALLCRQLQSIEEIERSQQRETYLIIYASTSAELLRLCANYTHDMPDVLTRRIDNKQEAENFLRRYLCFGSENSTSPMPDKIEFRQTYFKVNNKKYVAKINIDGYPEEILQLQYAALANEFPSATITIDMSPMAKADVLSKLSRSLQEIKGRSLIKQSEANILDNDSERAQLFELYDTIKNGNEQLLSHSMHIYACSSSLTALEEQVRHISEQLEQIKFEHYVPHNTAKDSFASLIVPDDNIKQAIPLHDTWKTQYPFFSQTFIDPHGVSFGNTSTGGEWVLDTFRQTAQRTSYSLCIMGSMGSGKSVALKDMIQNRLALGDIVIALDVEGELTDLAQICGGRVIKMSAGSTINVLELQQSGNMALESEHSNYASEIARVVKFFDIVSSAIGSKEMDVLEEILNDMYIYCGITAETQLSDIPSEGFPILDDLLRTIRSSLYDDLRTHKVKSDLSSARREILETLESAVTKLIKSYGTLFNGHSTIKLTNEQFVVFNLQDVVKIDDKGIFQGIIYNIIKLAWGVIVSNSVYNQTVINPYDMRNVIVEFEECHVYLNEDCRLLVEQIVSMLRRTRKYMAANWFVSQAVKDFVSDVNSASAKEVFKIFDLCQYKFIAKQDPSNRELLMRIFPEFTASEINSVSEFSSGDMLFSFSDSKLKMRCHKTIEPIDLLWIGSVKDLPVLRERWYEMFYGEEYKLSNIRRQDFVIDYTGKVMQLYGFTVYDSEYLAKRIMQQADQCYKYHGGAVEDE